MSDTTDFIMIRETNNGEIGGEKFTRISCGINELETRLNELPPNYSVFSLLANPSKDLVNRINQIRQTKPKQFLKVITRRFRNSSLKDHSLNLCFVSTTAVVYKIQTDIIEYLDRTSQNLFDSNPSNLGVPIRSISNRLSKQLTKCSKIKGCHVLLIPLNVNRGSFDAACERIRNKIHDLFPGEAGHQFVIRTLYEYIPPREDYYNENVNKIYLKKRYKAYICETIRDSSLIRIYVVGNEADISNEWTKKLSALELNIDDIQGVKYVDRCTFMTAPDVPAESIGDLCTRFPGTWQSTSIIPNDLSILETDEEASYFLYALDIAQICLQNREIIVNAQLRQRPEASSQSSSRSNSSTRSSKQSEDNRTGIDEPADVNV